MINYFPGKRKTAEHTCFVHNGGYYLAKVSVYEGGGIECWGLLTKQEFLDKVNSGWITIDLPDGAELRIGNQEFVVKQAETLNSDGSLMFKHKWITKESFIKDVLDSHNVSLGNKSASRMCFEAYDAYLRLPNDYNKKLLSEAYFNVPEHNRRFILGDQDRKDFPIREVLGI